MRMRPVDTVWIPRRPTPLLVVARVLVAVLIIASIVVVVKHLGNDVVRCSPPSQQEQQVQEAFVRSRVGDAHNLDWTIADCDDEGTGYLSFSTALAPTAARDAFLADRSCAPYREAGAGENDVTCKSGGTEVFIFFEAAPPSAGTKGELAL